MFKKLNIRKQEIKEMLNEIKYENKQNWTLFEEKEYQLQVEENTLLDELEDLEVKLHDLMEY